jgi:ribosomal-protein-alanine N-acetyltransferase
MRLELPFISSTRLLLRLATKEDVPEIIRYFRKNRGYLAPWVSFWPSNYLTKGFWQEQVEKNLKEFEYDQSLKLFIFKDPNFQEIVGSVNFNGFIRGAAQFCYLGYSLAEIEQSKGYMSEALGAATEYVFEELNMHRIVANYMPHNQRSGKVLKRLGFVVEGYAREYLLINGQWQDHILTSLTNKNWRAG